MDKRANNRSRKPRGEASKARNMASRTPRGLFVISRSGVQVRPPAPSSVRIAHIRFRASAKTHSLHRTSSSRRGRFAGSRRENGGL